MFIQLSESCVRSLHYTGRIRSYRYTTTKSFRMKGSTTTKTTTTLVSSRRCLFSKSKTCRPEQLQLQKSLLSGSCIDRQPIYYTTLAQLRATPLSPEDILVDTKARFDASLQQPKSMAELWSFYLAVCDSPMTTTASVSTLATGTTSTNNENKNNMNPITTDEYEQLMQHLYYYAQQARRSIHWQRMVQVYQDASPNNTNKAMKMMAITAYGRTGQYHLSQQTFDELKEQGWADELVYWHMMDASLNASRIKDAYHIFQEGKPVMGQDMVTRCFDRYVDVNIKKRNIARAMAGIQEWMPEKPTERLAKSLWTGYVQLMKRHGGLLMNSKDELQLLIDMEAFVGEFGRRVSNTITLPPNVQAIFTAKHLGILMDIWTRTYPDHVLSQKTYDGLLAIYAAQGDVLRLNGALLDMQQHNIQPTQDMLNALLRTSSVSTTATTTLSPSYLKSFFKSSNKGNLLDKEGYISFIQAFINSGDIESAQRAALQLKKRTFTIGTSSHMAIVQGWVRQGQMTKAETWLEKCNYIKWVSKGKCQSVLDPYAIIAEGYLQTGEWGRCVNLLEVVKKEVPTIAQQNRRMIKAALVARFARGDFYVCERILMEKQADFTPVTIQRIVQTMLGIKNKSVPGQTVVKGLELMETMLDVRVTATGLGRIIEKLGERGDLRAAYELYRRVRNERRPLGFVIYRSMMEAAVNNNNVVMAERIIYHMNRSSSSISTNNNPLQRSSCPTLSSYNMLLNAYASRQPEPHLSRMTRTFRRLLADGHRPDVTTYNTLIKAFIQMDNQSAALSIFQEMKTAGYRGNSWTINTLIQGWIAQMDWHGLEKFILEIKADEYTLDTITFNLMLEGLLRLNKYEIRLARLWKRQNRWPKLKQLQQRQQEANNSLSSEAVWEIFESSLGISITEGSNTGAEVMSNHQGSHDDGNSNNSSSNEDAKTSGHSDNNNSRMDHQEVYRFLLQHQKNSVQMSPQTTSSRTAFYTLFQNAKPDEVTFKLFMKAFQNANDPESAAKIHHYWMNQSKDH